MKKLFSTLILVATASFCLTGCNNSVSASLDKKDAVFVVPEDYEFTKVVSYNEYSKYCVYNTINNTLKNAKFRISYLGGGINMSATAIASVDGKTGERIGASKITFAKGASVLYGLTGSQMTYIRGAKSYSSFDFNFFTANPTNGARKTGSLSGKYYMDIPSSDEKGVGTFFGDNSAENPEFINPYFFLDKLQENGLISEGGTEIKKARKDGIDFYLIDFGIGFYDQFGITECEFILAMNGKKVYGVHLDLKYTQANMTSYSYVYMKPFTGTLKDVPTSFEGYDMSFEEYSKKLADEVAKTAR